jgi:ketosteroid isomerase-like protein
VGFLSVHSKSLVRAPRDAKTIFGWDEYLQQLQKGQSKNPSVVRFIELRFTERIDHDDLAFDVGIYKTTIQNKKGERDSSYGRFHVVLRKEYGIWKILVDTDSSEGGTIGEKDFLAANEM